MRYFKFKSLILLLACWIVTGCALMGGSEPKIRHSDNYKISAPQGWKSIAHKDSDEAYRLPSGAIATLTSSCDHRSEAPLEVLANHPLIGIRNRKIVSRSTKKFNQTEGLWSVVDVQTPEGALKLNLFVTKYSNCVFDFSLIHPKAISDGDQDEFKKFISSLEYENS